MALRLVFGVALLMLALPYLLASSKRKRRVSLPPSPPGNALLGNLTEFLRHVKDKSVHILVQEWSRQYGDVIRVRLGFVTNYYICSDVAVKELFDKASGNSTERPRWIVANELMSNGWGLLFMPSKGSTWRNQRKAVWNHLISPPRVDAAEGALNRETAKFLHEIACDPDAGQVAQGKRIYHSVGRYTYSAFSQLIFGMQISKADDKVIDFIEESGLESITATLPGSYLVDLFPWLQNLPTLLKPWHRFARDRFSRDLTWARHQVLRVKNEINSGASDDTYVSRLLKDENLGGLSCEDEVGINGMSMIVAAADTSRVSTWGFLEAMMIYPEVQAKARELIETQIPDRLPVWEDLEKLPYIRCIMKEVWRWRPPVTLGHSHVNTVDLVYNGMVIPKGSRLHLNAWAITHDNNRHEDADVFRPERYEGDLTNSLESMNSSDPKARDHFAFGAGRRACSGTFMAERSLAIAMMRLLWACEIVPGPEARHPLTTSDYAGVMPGMPGPEMPVTLRVINQHKRRIIEQTYQEEFGSFHAPELGSEIDSTLLRSCASKTV